jgi:Flp pilus assembly protein TadD
LWQAAVDTEPRAALAHANLGMALLRDHRAAEALPHFETARAIDGDKPEVRLGLATAYDQLGRAADAEAAARAAALAADAAADPDARPHALLGGILAKKGDLAGAAREAERARTLNPDLASAWTLSAHLAELRGAHAEAAADWRRAAAINPNAADFQAEIARLSLAAGDRPAAAAAARACLRLRPSDAACRSLLARAGSP